MDVSLRSLSKASFSSLEMLGTGGLAFFKTFVISPRIDSASAGASWLHAFYAFSVDNTYSSIGITDGGIAKFGPLAKTDVSGS